MDKVSPLLQFSNLVVFAVLIALAFLAGVYWAWYSITNHPGKLEKLVERVKSKYSDATEATRNEIIAAQAALTRAIEKAKREARNAVS